MYTYQSYQWICFFFIYCFFGWIFESTYVSLKVRHFVNRGFLRLPMLPLYGTGAVMMLWVSLPVRNNLFLVYLSGVFAATLLEYVTGYTMERLFKMKYWDYSNQRFNLHGYICLSSSIAWGFLTIFLTEVIHKPVERLVLNMNVYLEIALVGIVGIFFVLDVIESTKAALNLGKVLESMTRMKADLDEMQVQLNLLKLEAAQKVSEFKDEQAQKLYDYRQGTLVKASEIRESFQEAFDAIDLNHDNRLELSELKAAASQLKNKKIEELQEKIASLAEKRDLVSRGLNIHRLLLRNPTASSKQFREALSDIKEHMEQKINSHLQ